MANLFNTKVEVVSADIRYSTLSSDLNNLVKGYKVLVVVPVKISDEATRVFIFREKKENE